MARVFLVLCVVLFQHLALASITITFKLTALGCNFSGSRCVYDQSPSTGSVALGNTVTAGTNASAGGVGPGFGITNANAYAFLKIDGQVVWSKRYTAAQWVANLADTVQLGSYWGDACVTSNTNQTYTAVQRNQANEWQDAWWKLNGVLQKYQHLGPGDSGSYTFNFNPQTDTISWGLELVDINMMVTNIGDVAIYTPIAFTNTTASGGGVATNFSNGGATTNNFATVPANLSAGQPIPWTNYQQSGRIDFSGTSSTAARDDTLKAGFNAELEASESLKRELLKALIWQGTNGGASSITVSNAAGWTNGITKGQLSELLDAAGLSMTNAANGIKGYIDDFTLADAGYIAAAAAFGVGPVQAAIGYAGLSAPTDDGAPPGPAALEFPLGSIGMMTVQPSVYPFAGTIRSVLVWVIAITLAFKVQKDFFDVLKDSYAVPQARTAGTSVLGTNANLVSALLMASGVVGAVVAGFSTIMGYVFSVGHGAVTAISPMAAVDNLLWGGSFALQILPFAYLVSAVMSYFGFVITKGAIRAGVATILKFLVGL